MFEIHAENWKFKTSRYMDNGNNALVIMDMDESGEEIDTYAVCSVNPGREIPCDMIAVKDWSENEGMVEFLKKEGVIEGDPVERIPSGFVTIKVFMLTKKWAKTFLFNAM